MFCKKLVLKNFANFTGKHLSWIIFLIKLQAFRLATLLKRYSNTGVPQWNLRSFKRTPILKNICERLLFTGNFLVFVSNWDHRITLIDTNLFFFNLIFLFFLFRKRQQSRWENIIFLYKTHSVVTLFSNRCCVSNTSNTRWRICHQFW